MKHLIKAILIVIVGLNEFSHFAFAQRSDQAFQWPDGKQIALSLSFDDARSSQVNGGTDFLDRYGIKVTFYVLPRPVEQNLVGWKKAVASGHEIGNHSLNHPCTGNFDWSRANALEDYNLEKMRPQLLEANRQIEALLGVIPESFAYPCGETYVGRDIETASYIPLIAELFSTGRGWQDEIANNPSFCDFAQLRAWKMDGKDFRTVQTMLRRAKRKGHWVVLVGHEMGDEGTSYTTQLKMLGELIVYAQNPSNRIWLAPVGEVAAYINERRKPVTGKND